MPEFFSKKKYFCCCQNMPKRAHRFILTPFKHNIVQRITENQTQLYFRTCRWIPHFGTVPRACKRPVQTYRRFHVIHIQRCQPFCNEVSAQRSKDFITEGVMSNASVVDADSLSRRGTLFICITIVCKRLISEYKSWRLAASIFVFTFN